MISLVVPVYNEEEALRHFYKELKEEISKKYKNFEIIFVDDGSTDSSLDILKTFLKDNKRIKIFSFRRNQGKAEALTLGFIKARGDVIVTLDSDLQDKPSEIPKLLKKIDEGWDLVSGWRKNRQDSIHKILSSKIFNSVTRLAWGLKLHDYNCGLKAYTKDLAKSLYLYGGLHRFIPLLSYEQGFKVTEVPVSHDLRKFGKSKYGFSKLWKDLPDMFTMLFLIKFGKRPLHFFGIVGFLFLILGVGILLYLTLIKLSGEGIGNRPLLFLGMLLVLSGLQVFFTGFLADFILSTSQKIEKPFSLKYSSDKTNTI